MRTVPSPELVTMTLPSGEKAALRIRPSCARTAREIVRPVHHADDSLDQIVAEAEGSRL